MTRDRLPDDVTCVRCLEVRPPRELDRILWCETCVARARVRASRIGWRSGAGLVAVLGLYITLVIRPDLSLIPAAWVATLVMAFYLGSKAARELAYGYERIRNRPAVEAVPPGSDPGPASGEVGREGAA